MARIRKIIILTLLVSLCAVPTSAFASSKNSNQNEKKHFLSGIFSIFTPSKPNISLPAPSTINNEVNSFLNNLFGWFDNKKDDFKDGYKWDDDKLDSFALWEKYYCW